MAFRRPVGRPPGAAPTGGPRAIDADFEQAALAHIDSLFGTAMRLTRRAPDAEDLVQDTYLKAFRAAHQFEPGTNLKAWLFTILHNTFRNMRRHAGRNPVEVDSEAVERAVSDGPGGQSPEQMLSRRDLDADLKGALDALPDAFRQAVWLRDVEELSYAEVADVLGVPIGTVMSRISRGRRALLDGLQARRGAASGVPGKTANGKRQTELIRNHG
jgi:RNA polymerase sigma-70 factor (ECF subfamily)